MSSVIGTRIALAAALACGLAWHGYSKRSLNLNGALCAFIVGFTSFAVSYRFGVILILFYYTSSKLTKVKEDVKAKLEDNYVSGGQRGAVQVLACSVLGTAVCAIFFYYVGEDCHVDFGDTPSRLLDSPLLPISQKRAAAYFWSMYVAHYACAAADTWASELGILSKDKPRLVTTLFLTEVPHGTNGGMSTLGTFASMAGGAFIGIIYWIMSFFCVLEVNTQRNQFPMVVVGLLLGFLGSLIDSLLGATLQATYYSVDRKCIVKNRTSSSEKVNHVCGINLLSNEAVNVVSIFLTMLLSLWLSPSVFCLCDASQCS